MPAFHPFASENEALRWDFFVDHYADPAMQRRDPKYRAKIDGRPAGGILYPRAGTLAMSTTLRRRLKSQRPRQLLEAALEVFVDKGFAAARVDDVAAHAGVSKDRKSVV